MIKVYFETSSHAEHVATLSFEPTTEAFWDAMLLEASAQGFDKVTESIEDDHFLTDSRYWDCNCDSGYILLKADTLYCEKCGASHDEQPDSRVSEELNYLDEVDQFTTSEGEVQK